jgi:Ni/Co efflux regulator RcnB
MKKMLFGAVAMSLVAAPMALPTAAFAQDHGYDNHGGGNHGGDNHGGGDRGWQGDRSGWNPQGSYHYDKHYKERRLGRNDHVYRGGDGRYYCKRNDGTTGLVIGALGGGVAGNLLGGGTLGTLLGAGGGALLGRSIDRGNVKCR